MTFHSLLFVFALFGCEADATQLVVLIDTDYPVPSELGFVEVRISDTGGQVVSTSEFTLTDTPAPEDPTRFVVPFSLGVVPLDGDSSRRIMVDVDGLSPARERRLTRRAVTGFLDGRTLLLPMFLARSCEDVECAEEDQTCTELGCVSVIVDPGGLTEITPGEELLDSGGRDSGVDAADTGVDASDSGGDARDSSMDATPDARDASTDAADAGDSAPDALDAMADAMADAGTPLSCGTSRCVCDVGYCDATCASSGRCELVCSDVGCTVDATITSFLDLSCEGSASCTVNARTSSNAQVDCADGTTCDVDCRDTASCQVWCRGATSQCIVQCAGSSDCQLPTCDPGGTMMCPGNVLVCGRACP